MISVLKSPVMLFTVHHRRLGLTTGAQISVCKTPCLSTGTAMPLAGAETVQERPESFFNDLEGPRTQISRSVHSLTLNISKMAADTAIVTMEGE